MPSSPRGRAESKEARRPAPAAIACWIALFTACRESPPAPASPPRTAAEQIQRGARLFAANCAKCHDDSAEDSEDGPPLVGPGALPLDAPPNRKRTAKFHTALDVALFTTSKMPPTPAARAKLTSDDSWSILAFVLDANGIELSEPVGPGHAASIVLHP